MLQESNGQLSPQVWDQLYQAIDEPEGISSSLDHRVSAIPRHFLVHLRASINGLPVLCRTNCQPMSLVETCDCLSSKVKTLVRDLPSNERSVVVSCSKATIEHLDWVLTALGIGHRALFMGQKVESTEAALREWQSTNLGEGERTQPLFPVLLVQAGAAASGLTLTAVCRIFLMEPFLRQSEEQQA
jgi:hypothetical protein